MGIEAAAGKAVGFLERYVARYGRVNPWVGVVGLVGAAIAGAVYRNRRDERRIREAALEAFREEIRERDLWAGVRSRVAGAAEALYGTFHVYRKGDVRPILHRGHGYKPAEGELAVPVDEPDAAGAAELLGRALESLAASRAGDLPLFREREGDPIRGTVAALKKVRARLERVQAGTVKRPDYPGMQRTLHELLEERVNPVVSDLSHAVDRGTERVRAEVRRRPGRGQPEA